MNATSDFVGLASIMYRVMHMFPSSSFERADGLTGVPQRESCIYCSHVIVFT